MTVSKRGGSVAEMSIPWLEKASEAWIVRIKLQPGARKTRVIGEHADQLKVAIAAPPVDGKANEALLKWLRVQLRLPRAEVMLLSGQTSRDKRVALGQLQHLSAKELSQMLLGA